uniref:C2 domain-containing protein n=1 Tax=Macrostomum lignano TaxID=282301 RepID=A0A1I8IXI6_9PLAT
DDELSLLSSTCCASSSSSPVLDTLIAEATDCAFLIWHGQRPVLQIHLADLYTGGQDVNRVHYLFAALADASRFLLGARHAAPPSGVIEAFESEMSVGCSRIHAHLQLDDRNPLRRRTARPALHDWRTYAEMKSLGPAAVPIGLTLLEIMRNINVFVASTACTTLTTKSSLRSASNNKHLNTINIRHVGQLDSNPRHRHNEHNDEGLTFLDHFRLLITQIGNAMGYVRMIRSGGLNCCSSAIRFVPDLEDNPGVRGIGEQGWIGARALTTAKAQDYFAMLVDVFAKEFRDKKNAILRNVHVIVPALTVNFVGTLVQCKDRLNKKNKTGAAFSDDGFAWAWPTSGMSDIRAEFALLDQGLTSARIFFRAEKEGGGGGGSGGSGGAGDSAAAAPTSAETAEATRLQ